MTTVIFKFSIGQNVKLKKLGGDGRIMALQYEGVETGNEYKVRYFNNGEEKFIWFFEDELDSMS